MLAAIRQATAHRTLRTVQQARRLSAEWLSEHPEDYAVWDAGGTLSLLEDALLTMAPELLATPSASAPSIAEDAITVRR